MIKRFVALFFMALPWWSLAQDVTAGRDRLFCYWDGIRAITDAERRIQIQAREEIYIRNLSGFCESLRNNKQFSLPRCPQGTPLSNWNDCVGSVIDSRGYKYVGVS